MNILLAFNYIQGFFLGKKSYFIGSLLFSFSFSAIVQKIGELFKAQEDNTSMWALGIVGFVVGVLIFVDFIYGILANKKIDKEEFKIQSAKVGTTIGKYLGVGLYSMIVLVIFLKFQSLFVMVLMLGPLFLTGLKEFISIGENMETVGGSKPYIFIIIDRLFDSIEKRFFKEAENFIEN